MQTVTTNSTNTNKQWGWMAMLLIAVLSLAMISCSDNSSSTDPDPEEEPADSAWLLGYRTSTPQGAVYYMEVNEDIPSETNQAEAVEIGFNADVFSYGGHPYTYNADAKTITKWDVDRTSLELSTSGVLSFASSGISGFVEPPIFLSETEAYMIQLSEGLVVEWNPSTMEISEVYDVTPLPDLGTDLISYNAQSKYSISDGKIFMPVFFAAPVNCCSNSELPQPPGAMVAVFDPASGFVQYNRNDGLYSITQRAYTDPVTDNIYVSPSPYNGIVSAYFDTTDLPPMNTLLKVNQDGTFDESFSFDMSEVLDIRVVTRLITIYDNKVALTYIDTADYDFPPSYSDKFDVFDQSFKSVVIDLETKNVTPFTGFNNYGIARFANTIDGEKYYYGYGGTGSASNTSAMFRQNGVNDFTKLSTHNEGRFQAIGKLW